MSDNAKPLDGTDVTQVISSVQGWINGLNILGNYLWLEYVGEPSGIGLCIKSDGGAIVSEDITGDFSAEIPFAIYARGNVVPDGADALCKPLNDLGAWLKRNGPLGLGIGARRTVDKLYMTKGPSDLTGLNEDGNTEFFAVFAIVYDEEAE